LNIKLNYFTLALFAGTSGNTIIAIKRATSSTVIILVFFE
jgi:hypothetical protein